MAYSIARKRWDTFKNEIISFLNDIFKKFILHNITGFAVV